MPTQKEYIDEIAPVICKYAYRYGYDFPSAIIAQALHESSFGKSKLSSEYFNLFGMKPGSKWQGKVAIFNTWEDRNKDGVRQESEKITSKFRAYTTLADGIKGYFDFINFERYSNLRDVGSPEEYLTKIAADGWATDGKYAGKIIPLIDKYDLRKFDGLYNFALICVDEGKVGKGLMTSIRYWAKGYSPKMVRNAIFDLLT